MSAFPVTDERYPPIYFRRFEAASLTSAVVLHAAEAPSVAQHLPCQLIVEAGDADDVLEVTDAAGTVSAISFPAVGTYVLRLAPVSIGGASTDVDAVTVCWSQRG